MKCSRSCPTAVLHLHMADPDFTEKALEIALYTDIHTLDYTA
jgi:hypothetical protein